MVDIIGGAFEMEAIRICAVCGRVISEDDGWNIVNEGTDKEYIE